MITVYFVYSVYYLLCLLHSYHVCTCLLKHLAYLIRHENNAILNRFAQLHASDTEAVKRRRC